MKRVLLLKPGVTSSKALLGDYEVWFRHACAGLAELHPVELHAGERPPSWRDFDAVLMSGSPLSVTAPVEWMARAADSMLEAAQRVPVLGVCFGHQLLAWRLGAQVVPNPLGRELGTQPVRLTPAGRADPLFHGLPETVEVQETHEDAVEAPPPGAQVLAENDACPVQAFAWGPRLHGVQFHPEMNAASIRHAIRAEQRLAPPARAALVAGAKDTPWGAALLQNFVRSA